MGDLAEVRAQLCNRLNEEFDKTLRTLLGAKSVISPELNALKRLLRATTFSPPEALAEAVRQVSQIAVPPFDKSDATVIKDFISQCAFLKTHDFLSKPINILRQLEDTIRESAMLSLQSISDILGVPEIGLAAKIQKLIDIVKKFGFDKLLPETSMVIDCIRSLCPGLDISHKLARYSMLQKLLDLTAGGELDLDKIYEQSGLVDQAIRNMNDSVQAVARLFNKIGESIANGVKVIKESGQEMDWP